MLKVRVIAPLEKRVAIVQERLKMSPSDAMAYIHKVDEDRRKGTRYLYGVNWKDPDLYDVVVNLSLISVPEACAMVAEVARQKCFEFDAECRARMEDLAIGNRLQANLALNPATSHLEFEVTSRHGRVTIQGRVTSLDEVEEIKRVAKTVPGVAALDLDELFLPLHA